MKNQGMPESTLYEAKGVPFASQKGVSTLWEAKGTTLWEAKGNEYPWGFSVVLHWFSVFFQ